MGSVLPVSPPMSGMPGSFFIYLTLMTSMKPLIMSSYHFQTHGLGRVMVTNAVVALGPSYACCTPGPSSTSVAMANGWD